MAVKSNNPPDVILELTHEQATFLLDNAIANRRLCMQFIMQIAEHSKDIDDARKRSEKFVDMNEKFGDIMSLLRRAGAREKED